MFTMYGLQDLVNYEAVELAVVGLQNELAISPEVVLGEERCVGVHSEHVVGEDVEEVGGVPIGVLGVKDRG